ncbi:MAG: helix-turn-helix transcriptional regulator, partial [bacterium]|nr:helix-turn-helix transcriptional regulator [bacterium]
MTLKQRIREDTRLVADDDEAAALLACLIQHLFHPDLDATFLARKSGASRRVRRRLAAKVGPLRAYVKALRMIEAARLMLETDLPVVAIAKRLGYREVRTFHRAFNECHPISPSEMRKQARAEPKPDPVAAASNALEGLEDGGDSTRQARRLTPRARAARLRRRAALGLEPERGGEAREELRRLYPGLETPDAARPDAAPPDAAPPSTGRTPEDPYAPVMLMPAGEQLDAIAASAVFGKIIELPDADLRYAMLDGVRMGTGHAFDVLKQVCFARAKWDPERAVTTAELGVQLIEVHRELLGETAADWKALAWIFLAWVQLLIGDFGAADRALTFAWEEVAGGVIAPWAEAEVRRLEGALRMRQARGAEAVLALDRAVELGRGLGPDDSNRVSSVVERLALASYLDDAETALALCDELEALGREGAAGTERDALWRCQVSYHRGKAFAAAGDDRRARSQLRAAAEHIRSDPEHAEVYDLAVFGGLVLHQQARLAGRGGRLERYDRTLRDALECYRQLRTPVLAAGAQA